MRAGTFSNDVLQCTVVGPDLIECQVWSRLLCTLSLEAGLSLFTKRSTDCEALIMTKRQEMHFVGHESALQEKWHDLQANHFHFQKTETLEN
jgi:thiamine biosynthesis lipoprotein